MPKFVYPFGNLDVIRIPGTLHQLGTPFMSVTLWDTRAPHWKQVIAPAEMDPATFDVVVTVSQALDGVVILLA